MSHLLCAFTLKIQWKHQYDTFCQNPLGNSRDIVCFIFSLFLVTAEAEILDGQFVEKLLLVHAKT